MDPPDKQGNDIVKIEVQGRGPHSYPPRFEGYRMHGSEPVKGWVPQPPFSSSIGGGERLLGPPQ